MRNRSVRALLLPLAPVTAWTFCLFLIYGAETLVCIPPVAEARTGIWIAPIVVSALVATGATAFAVRRRLKRDKDDAERFVARMSIELAGLAALAIVWIALAAVTVPLCALR